MLRQRDPLQLLDGVRLHAHHRLELLDPGEQRGLHALLKLLHPPLHCLCSGTNICFDAASEAVHVRIDAALEAVHDLFELVHPPHRLADEHLRRRRCHNIYYVPPRSRDGAIIFSRSPTSVVQKNLRLTAADRG